MARSCSVCSHAERITIESERKAGVAFRTLAERFNVGVVSSHLYTMFAYR